MLLPLIAPRTCARRTCVLLSALLLVLTGSAAAQSASIPVSWSTAAVTQYPTPLPVGTVNTAFTGYSGVAIPYVLGTFTVTATGTYSASLTGVTIPNGVAILTGTFAPSSGTPATPPSAFIAGEQTGGTTTLPALSLQAGVLYSYLLLFEIGTTGSGGTFTISGPGSVCLGGSCSSVPVLSPIALGALMVLLAASAVFLLARGSRTSI